MGTASRLRREALARGEGVPFRSKFTPSLRLRCGECKEIVYECNVTDHLKKCQPDGALCEKCNKKVPAAEFIEHIRKCEGPPLRKET